MAGTISISLQQQFHKSTGLLLSGGRLEFLQSGTIQTKQNAFKDSSLSINNVYGNPLILESDGRVPFLWFADGSIKIRLSDTTGTVQFEADNLPIIGSSGGGGGVDTTDPNSIFSTGMPLWMPSTGTKAGWVRLNARTIGSATSGATERANADCEQLYLHKWNNFTDAICPVGGGRGATAAADWAANKAIGTINMRGKGAFGVTDMGNTDLANIAAGYVTTGSPTIGGSFGGDDDALIAQANIPNYTLSHTLDVGGSIDSGSFYWSASRTNISVGGGSVINDVAHSTNNSQGLVVTGLSVTGSVTSGGSGTRLPTMPNFVLGTWYMRL